MDLGEAGGQVGQQRPHLVGRQRSGLADSLLERVSLGVFGDEVGGAVLLGHEEGAGDLMVVHLGQQAGIIEEVAEPARVGVP